MKDVTATAVCESAHGKKLETPFDFSFVYSAYEDYADVAKNNDLFTNEEVVDERNTQRKQKALAAARTAELEKRGIKKPEMKDDVLLQLNTVYKVYIAKGKSHEEARALAAAAISEEWPA